MARALAEYDVDLKRDAGLRASYAIERWWKERDEMTGRYYDKEVALLISSTIDIKQRSYSGASHRNWWSNYRKRIESFRKYDVETQVKYREEKRILEECAARMHRRMLWDFLLDPDGKHPILRLNADLANTLQHGMREGDKIVALMGVRPASCHVNVCHRC